MVRTSSVGLLNQQNLAGRADLVSFWSCCSLLDFCHRAKILKRVKLLKSLEDFLDSSDVIMTSAKYRDILSNKKTWLHLP